MSVAGLKKQFHKATQMFCSGECYMNLFMHLLIRPGPVLFSEKVGTLDALMFKMRKVRGSHGRSRKMDPEPDLQVLLLERSGSCALSVLSGVYGARGNLDGEVQVFELLIVIFQASLYFAKHIINKVSEKVGGAEGTKLDDDFKEMERKVDVTSRAVMEIMTKTIEYLQPNPANSLYTTEHIFQQNFLAERPLRLEQCPDCEDTSLISLSPASRAKLSMINTMSKIRGQEKGPGYPQAEALLAEAMLKFGRELGDDCNFGPALGEVGEAMRELSEVKDSLDMEVKQNFIDPLQNLHDKDLREIQHHLKKLEGRRLDFDYKKKRQGKIPDEELRQALEKFDESKEIAESSMFNLLEMDIEQVSQLSALIQAQLEYHKQAVQILQQVTVRLEERIRQASSQPRREYQPKPRMSLEFTTGDSTQPNGGLSHTSTPKPAGAPMDQPCCRALYDFEPENEGELGFKEGDIITLTNQIDENWYEGMLHGQSGFFPINYVEILVALPH
ncbi:hypothetical protein EI555_017357 [Monodon monoceros]|uniref:SH3 domain-containing protein n=2 Tax=Odontoceti TaxID=9722 RepID=A0A4U1ETL0_MONMO|nr:hypothetical protein EI555_017357 [Monodon monoceros]